MEPMDLDHNRYGYRSNSLTSASPPVSPRDEGGDMKRNLSDMEIDPNSPPSSYYHNRQHYHQPDSYNNASYSLISSPSLDCMNQSLNNILSLKNFGDNRLNSKQDFATPKINNVRNKQHPPTTQTPPRICQSAPPVFSPFFKLNQDPIDDNVNNVSESIREDRAKTSLGQMSSSFKSKTRKTGYGITDDNFDDKSDDNVTFSHYPLSSSREQNVKNVTSALRSRAAQRPETKTHVTSSNTAELKSCDGIIDTAKSKKDSTNNCVKTLITVFIKMVCLFISICLIVVLLQILMEPTSCDIDNDQIFQNKILKVDLKTDLFGQHIASKLIQKHVKEYFERYTKSNSSESQDTVKSIQGKSTHCRPLVLSLHGWTGVGKNFGSRILSQSFSPVVTHPFIIPLLFPHMGLQQSYADQIQDWITSNITQCSVNVFVIDEMDKAFPEVQRGLLNTIYSLTDSCSTSTSPIIFILISNTHAAAINQVFVDRYISTPPSSHQKRTDLKEDHFHAIFNSSILKHEWYTDFSLAGVIDAFIPFLPLEKIHVIDCIKRDLISKHLSTDSDVISSVLKELSFTVYGDLELSTTGCKRVSDKVNYVVYNNLK